MVFKTAIMALALTLLASPVLAGERAAAEVACAPTAEALVYSCTLVVTARKSAEPVVAEAISVKADMPSMPMAHNIPPASAKPMDGMPGHYMATLELEMHGEWALAIEVDGKTAGTAARVRDKVIVKQEFGAGKMQGAHKHGLKHGSGHGAAPKQ